MTLNFDLHICINTIDTRQISCFAPQDLRDKRAVLRCDQYCCSVVLSAAFNRDSELPLLKTRQTPTVTVDSAAPSELQRKLQSLQVQADKLSQRLESDGGAQTQLKLRKQLQKLQDKAAEAWLRVHVQLSGCVRFADAESGVPCNCQNIIPWRLLKYRKRGYRIEVGALQDDYDDDKVHLPDLRYES